MNFMGRTKTKPFLKRKKVPKLYFHIWPSKKCIVFVRITWSYYYQEKNKISKTKETAECTCSSLCIHSLRWMFRVCQNHEILKQAILGFYIRFHPVYRPCFYLPRKQIPYIKIQEWL